MKKYGLFDPIRCVAFGEKGGCNDYNGKNDWE